MRVSGCSYKQNTAQLIKRVLQKHCIYDHLCFAATFPISGSQSRVYCNEENLFHLMLLVGECCSISIVHLVTIGGFIVLQEENLTGGPCGTV